MAAKWKAQQRKQRWEHSTVLLPSSVLSCVDSEPGIGAFATVLREWSSLSNTYQQVAGAKRLVGALESLAASEAEGFCVALSSSVEILFQEGSRPVHRTILSALAQLKSHSQLVENAFLRCCTDHGLGGQNERRFALVGIGLSLASLPKPGILENVVKKCAFSIIISACFDVRDVLGRAEKGENPTPALMEDCQDAMSTVYYMLQHCSRDCSQGVYYGEAVSTSLDVLQTGLMSRDCVVAAGVCLCAAAQMLTSSISSSALVFAEALFPQQAGSRFKLTGETQEFPVLQEQSLAETIASVRGGATFASEAAKLTDFGRLCVLRGLLTAAPRELLNFSLIKEPQMEKWTLLYEGILPALCDAAESSHDSHFKFHAMTALQICLQQIKASAGLQNSAISSAMTTRIMQIIWNNWEDPLNQTVRQVQMVFDLLADLQSTDSKTFLHSVASDLLKVGGHRKGRYVPLATLASRIGARTLLQMCPELLYQTVHAMSEDGVCCAASSFLKSFLERLRDECWTTEGISGGTLKFRNLWIPPMFEGLVSGNPKLRSNLQTYGLSVGLEIDSDGLLEMLSSVLKDEGKGLTMNQRVASFVSLLKVGRALALVENEIKTLDEDYRQVEILVKGTKIYAPVSLLELALIHLEEGLRVDAAELVCLNPKTAVMPSALELHLMELAMPLNMRSSSTAFRMKWTSLLKKFFNRVRIATEKQAKNETKDNGIHTFDETDIHKTGDTYQVQKLVHANGVQHKRMLSGSVVSLDEMRNFMYWLTRLLISSLYPSAPYERKYMAMEILKVVLDTWPITEKIRFSPYGKEIFSADYIKILLGALVDSWDRLRESAFDILTRYPTPLPGLETEEEVVEVLNWGKLLANSPRVRESDAGALVLRLMFRKYVCQLYWRVKLHPVPEVVKKPKPEVGDEIVQYIESLNDWLEEGVLEGEKSLLKACQRSLVHGVLLSFRYTVCELDWVSEAVRSNVKGLRRAFGRLLGLLLKVSSLALWVVSVDALSLQVKQQEGLEVVNFDEDMSESEEEDENGSVLAPTEQMVMVGCWLSMKEVSLLLGTIARGAPLPGCSFNIKNEGDSGKSFIMLEPRQLEEIGQHFLQVLLAMKHNGAIDKTRVGFVALCNRLLLSSDTSLSKMPEIWMQQLNSHMVAKGHSLDDLLRRSAGIPASFLALFLSEPDGAPKKLLPTGLRWLLNNIKRFLSDSSNLREDDVVPIVHAFNTLRVIFNDTYLATDTSGFCAEALIISVKAFASPYWQVRNSATLAFTSLLHRTVGILNVHERAITRKGVTGFEFFNRYPALHPFLLKELELATMQLERNSGNESRLHPSLAPILIILSRLRPSVVNTRIEDWLSPSAFMPSVMRCATQADLKVRALASRALAPLVTPEKLLSVLSELTQSFASSKKPHFNAIHGVLLQMSSLLRSNCKELPQHEQQTEIVLQVFKKLIDLTWLGSAALNTCPIIVGEFLTVLKELLELAYLCQQSSDTTQQILRQILRILLRLSAEGMQHVDSRGWDSTHVDLRATASRIYFSTLLREWLRVNVNGDVYKTMSQVHEDILCLENIPDFSAFYTTLREALADGEYEVRLATLKALKHTSTSEISEFIAKEDTRRLQGILTERLYVEVRPRCIKRILQVFLGWNMLRIGEEAAMKIWNTLLGFYKTSTVSKTKEYSIRCLGSCLQHILVSVKELLLEQEGDGKWEVYNEVFDVWDELITRHSTPSEPVNLRRAVSLAIVSSKCLEDASWLKEEQCNINSTKLEWYNRIVLRVWSVTINLLEDEDITLRQNLALSIQQVMFPEKQLSNKSVKACVPAQVERVLEMSIDFLCKQFEGCEFFFDFLAQRILGEDKPEIDARGGDLVRKLFDKELDNHHEEQLLVVQLCCSHMRTYVKFEARHEFILRWRNKFLDRAVACTRWCLELQKSTQWIGGITNHQDVFKYFYRTLLGLLVLAAPEKTENVHEDSRWKQSFEAGLLELTRLKGVPLSPMISNLLLRLLVEFERVFGNNSLGADIFEHAISDGFCEDFEPFFLLK